VTTLLCNQTKVISQRLTPGPWSPGLGFANLWPEVAKKSRVGAIEYGENGLPTFERIPCAFPAPSGRNVYFRPTQGKRWAKLSWHLRAV
jgi:hypothetical protein